MRGVCLAQEEMPRSSLDLMGASGHGDGMTRIFLAACVGALALNAWAADNTDVEQYAFANPSACIQQTPGNAERWTTALSLFASRDYVGARREFLYFAGLCPSDPAPRHMAALCAWALGDQPQAVRRLVQVLRLPQPPAASAIAMAALRASTGTDVVAIGWLRRGLQQAPKTEHAYWISRPAFDRLWQESSPAWTDLLEEFELPRNQADVQSIATPMEHESSTPAEEQGSSLSLRLSPFNPRLDSIEQAAQMRQQVDQRLIDRIRISAGISADLESLPDPAESSPEQP